MKKRKHLCLIICNAIAQHSNRLAEGVIKQCKKYDYDLSVVSTATTLEYFNRQYATGAANIYNLINFSLFDGIIVDTLNLSSSTTDLLSGIYERIKEQATCPVVNLSYEYAGYKTITSKNDEEIRSMVRHMIEVHGYRDFSILTGPKENPESIQRLKIMRDELSKYSLSVNDDNVFYGDFWYTSGEQLADRITSGEVKKPEAILCASNHMGLGLINRLVKNGYKVPDDVAVIAFDSVVLSMLNDIPMSSYDSNWIGTSADAVDYIRSIIEPEMEVIPFITNPEMCFSQGRSCGCQVVNSNLIKALGPYIYKDERNFFEENLVDKIDIGYLMEGDSYEKLSTSQTIEECLYNICDSTFVIRPFEKFYLCLKDRWEDFNEDITSGYTDKMKLVIRQDETTGESFYSNENSILFDTNKMLPDLFSEREGASVFYFISVHFNDTIFGYAVLQRKLGSKPFDIVYRNWIRFVSSSLEMIRMRESYLNMSIKDPMTGLTNKRGMYEALNKMLSKVRPDDCIYVAVIDMDNLKIVNDTYGHVEGDICLKRLSHIINLVTNKNEISVRAGGDEFYVIGVGEYTEDMLKNKITEFEQVLEENSEFEGKEYKLSASIGNTLWTKEIDVDIDEVIQIADKKMYDYKKERKKNRK